MLIRALVEIVSRKPDVYSYTIKAEGEDFSFADLKARLEHIFECDSTESLFDEDKVKHAIDNDGVFTLGRRT